MTGIRERNEHYCQNEFEEDEEEFDPEGEGEDAMMAVMDAETLVFGTQEDGADDVAADEEEEEQIVQTFVAVGVEDAE